MDDIILKCLHLLDLSHFEVVAKDARAAVAYGHAWGVAASMALSNFSMHRCLEPSSRALTKSHFGNLRGLSLCPNSIPVHIGSATQLQQLVTRTLRCEQLVRNHLEDAGHMAKAQVGKFRLSEDAVIAAQIVAMNRRHKGAINNGAVYVSDVMDIIMEASDFAEQRRSEEVVEGSRHTAPRPQLPGQPALELEPPLQQRAPQGMQRQLLRQRHSHAGATRVELRLAFQGASSVFLSARIKNISTGPRQGGERHTQLRPAGSRCPVFLIDINAVSPHALLRVCDMKLRADGSWVKAMGFCDLSVGEHEAIARAGARSNANLFATELVCAISLRDFASQPTRSESESQVHALQLDQVRR